MSWKVRSNISAIFIAALLYILWSTLNFSAIRVSPVGDHGEISSPLFLLSKSKLNTYHEHYSSHYKPSVSLEELEKRHNGRKKKLQEVCANGADNRSIIQNTMGSITKEDIPLLEKIIVDEEHELLYCYVPKVASTSWRRFLIALTKKANFKDVDSIDSSKAYNTNLFRWLSNYTLPEIKHRLEYFRKFVFVRHPLARILSAYRAIFERDRSKSFCKRYAPEIVRLYRPKNIEEKFGNGYNVTFPEFASYITDRRPFVESGMFDEHWAPVVDLCLPCKIQYDIIGKYETFADDVWYVREKAKLGHEIRFPGLEFTKGKEFIHHHYFTKLSALQISELYRVYSEDFSVFNYAIDVL